MFKTNGKLCLCKILGTLGYILCGICLFIPNIPSSEYDTFLYVSTALLLGINGIEKIKSDK